MPIVETTQLTHINISIILFVMLAKPLQLETNIGICYYEYNEILTAIIQILIREHQRAFHNLKMKWFMVTLE